MKLLGWGLLLTTQSACAGKANAPPLTPAEMSDAPATALSPEAFATETHALLLTKSRNQKNKLLLAGVVQYQLSRAQALFEEGFEREGEDTVAGALLLLRHDDELLSATRGQGRALLAAAGAAASRGDAGRALALYQFTLKVLEDKALRADVTGHLDALDAWNKSTGGSSDLERLGEQTRQLLARSVADPRAETYQAARAGIIDWMHAALASSASEGDPESREERDLALEAYRAIRTGAPAMIALNLRQGTPRAAVAALEEAGLGRAMPPGISALLEATAGENAPDAWLELFRQVEGLRSQEGSESGLPMYMADGAALWAAIELYRSSPGEMESAMPLAMSLVEFGMPEVASTLLSQNSNEKTSPEALTWSLSLVLRGLLELSRTNQLTAARRSYDEASGLLSLAEKSRLRGPSTARAHTLMAALETRHGHAARAIPLLRESVALERDPETLIRLAQLETQQGEADAAKKHLDLAISESQKAGDLLTESRAEEELFRHLRKTGQTPAAKEALERALRRVLVLRQMQSTGTESAPVERQLAHLLVYYGEARAARSAYERALAVGHSDLLELEVTLTDMARSALTLGDVRMGRLATRNALSLGLPAENSVYIALWQQLLERKTNSPRDGVSQEVLGQATKTHGWIDYLRRFGLGELGPSELSKAAQGIPEETEAKFYVALTSGGHKGLAPVAESPAVDLIEVGIAQDLLARDKKFALPSDITLPEGSGPVPLAPIE